MLRVSIVGLGNFSRFGAYENTRHNVGQMFLRYLEQQHQQSTLAARDTRDAVITRVPLIDASGAVDSGQRSPKPEKLSVSLKALFKSFTSSASVADNHLDTEMPTEMQLVIGKCYMNTSGSMIPSLLNNTLSTPHLLIVVHDELSKPAGKFGWKIGGSAHGHNGVSSIHSSLRSKIYNGKLLYGDFIRLRIGIGEPSDRGDMAKYVLQNISDRERNVLQDVVFPECHRELFQVIHHAVHGASHIKKSKKAITTTGMI